MDRTHLLPTDPIEAAQVPVESVDLPEADSATQTSGQAFVEHDELAKRELPGTADIDLTTGPNLDEAVQAAQRGRTA